MFEHRTHPLLPTRAFLLRLLRAAGVATTIVFPSLAIGTAGYHLTEGWSWLDSLMSAAMLLSGMGPPMPVLTAAGKLFATFYALFSGLVFLTVAAVVFAPLFHRIIHRFHLEIGDEDDEKPLNVPPQ